MRRELGDAPGNEGGKYLHGLRFADDVVLMGECGDGPQEITRKAYQSEFKCTTTNHRETTGMTD